MASVRPMQSELNSQLVRDGTRPRSWIPAEVWQKQGMSAQEMTLPLGMMFYNLFSFNLFFLNII